MRDLETFLIKIFTKEIIIKLKKWYKVPQIKTKKENFHEYVWDEEKGNNLLISSWWKTTNIYTTSMSSSLKKKKKFTTDRCQNQVMIQNSQ